MNPEVFGAVQERFPWFFVACFAVFGALVGSFLNVCIYRLPKGLSVVRPGSHCACGTAIPWWRNVPVVSWFALRGRAPCCGRRFSFRYPLVESLTGALFALCWYLLPWQQALPGMVFFGFLIVLAFIDLDTMFLPDLPNGALAFVGLLFSLLFPGLHGEVAAVFSMGGHEPGMVWDWSLPAALRSVGDSLAGMAFGAGLIYWVRFTATSLAGREAMGEGDVILCGGIGAFCGWQGALFSLLGGAVLGSLVMLPVLIVARFFAPAATRGDARRRAASLASFEDGGQQPLEQETLGNIEVPFGPWLALGAVAWFLFFRLPMAHYVANAMRVLGW
jgi:leader peptidase (prepilin peptidase)/N-methyltransferase